MTERLMDVPLTRFEGPIRQALGTYQEISDNGLVFDPNAASKLQLTPEMPNSARSATSVLFMTEKVGTLYVIAFKPGDGTGKESEYRKLSDLKVGSNYPNKTLIVPRNKDGVYHEAHLTIVRHVIENVHAEPEMFAGTFDLIGLDGKRVVKIGQLGQKLDEQASLPLATFTVGFDENGLRFGDPHAVYSGISNAVQLCAFLAISNEIHNRYQHILDGLKPQFPIKA
jgi:hypothetical protein